MATEEALRNEITALEDQTNKVNDEIQAYSRKLMQPVWEQRREIVKKIPHFWAEVFGNHSFFSMSFSQSDLEAMEKMTDFHVEYDENKPDYRKITATFEKNPVFKNGTLTKEFTLEEDEGKVLSKSTIEYHSGKEPSKKRKAPSGDDEDFDDFPTSLIEWFGDDDVRIGAILSEDVFPGAMDYYQNDEESLGDDDDEEDLGSDDDEDDEPPAKKSKN
ncbi:hypothetical protein DFQ28_011179 [Apophysomyces sp. BC1034]|nr:hypothetical protein DFQ30_008412 [Apophysomyces sp. BC1015]KAG0182655.1 hypothetical protein DFQ29_002987 [Apophysomyces sp. BC1021]KAG0191704.1 hypothetical protein DFQ28_011179 [Apophysomyces sp. BC1034]